MLKELNIALFADADNCGLEYSHFDNTLFQLNEMGNVVYGKIYGVSDRKHKEIINDINKFGFDMAPVMRVKKRGSKVFDNRILRHGRGAFKRQYRRGMHRRRACGHGASLQQTAQAGR